VAAEIRARGANSAHPEQGHEIGEIGEEQHQIPNEAADAHAEVEGPADEDRMVVPDNHAHRHCHDQRQRDEQIQEKHYANRNLRALDQREQTGFDQRHQQLTRSIRAAHGLGKEGHEVIQPVQKHPRSQVEADQDDRVADDHALTTWYCR
jgi:hypothetical protein